MASPSPLHLPLPRPPPGSWRDHPEALPSFDPGPESERRARARSFLDAGRERIAALHRAGAAGQTVVRLTTALTDRLVRGLWDALTSESAPQVPLSLVALGGYGRRELAPRSDLDLMLLRPAGRRAEAPAQQLAERLLYLLWDLRLEVGWSLRTAAEAEESAEEDHTARTALLDCRYLAGDTAQYAALEQTVVGDVSRQKADRFIADKIAEVQARRHKFGDSLYLLEPNLKNGEGGLRDLQAALWIALARFHVRGLTQLAARGVLPEAEVEALRAARDFLWRVRNQLHMATARKEDRLTFELQEAVAPGFGYAGGEALPVEQFMRDYYLCARQVKQAAEALMDRGAQPARPRAEGHRVGEFRLQRDKLSLEDPEQLTRDPLCMLRLFATSERLRKGLHPEARDAVGRGLHLLQAPALQDQAAVLLAELMAEPGTLGGFLGAMHEAGLLGAVLPEFGRVTALRQHDLYHVYTVDAHSLFAVRRLYALRAGERLEEQPELTTLMQELPQPLALYLGMLFHDAGKGLGGNHSERGVELVHAVATRMGLPDDLRRDAEFLVRAHLLMSHTSQRRDLSDPALIAQFAAEVGTLRRLRLLYLLTWADISSVGPTTWTAWKGRLLRELYVKAEAALQGQTTQASVTARYVELRDGITARLHQGGATDAHAEVEQFLRGMPSRYLAVATPARAQRDLKLLRRTARAPLGALLLQHAGAPHTTLSLTAPDRPGLLATFAGLLAAHGVDILAADVFSVSPGRGAPSRALDVFEVLGPGGEPLRRDRFGQLKRDLGAVLAGTQQVEQVLARRQQSRLAPRKVPRVATRVALDQGGSRDFTILDVVAEDRVGLLYAITAALFRLGLDVHAARITTEANRAIDAFYVRRAGQKVTAPQEAAELEQALRAAIDAR
jgi:[protein-PII] uridylyltransferase